jgi:acyl-CoA synthetase (AMP-forming)/AMP-acid ligase II
MSNRKNYNSIVFLAAFFGLVLVGATPHVLAQNSELTGKPVNCNFVSSVPTICIEANWIADLGKVLAENPKSTYTYVKADYIKDDFGLFDWKIQKALGNQKALDFLNEKVFCFECDLPKFFQSQKISHEIEITESEIRSLTQVAHYSIEKAKSYQSKYTSLAISFDLYRKETDPAELLFWKNTSARSENNQVFIVTRLPRASIDELLAENAR